MAGLGERCSHVASPLRATEAGVQIRDSTMVMQKKAYWTMPNGVKDVSYAPVKALHLSERRKVMLLFGHRSFGGITHSPSQCATPTCRSSKSPIPAFEEEKRNFFCFVKRM